MKQNMQQDMDGRVEIILIIIITIPITIILIKTVCMCAIACVQLQDVAGFNYVRVRSYTATSMYARGLTMCVTRAGWREERCPIWRTGGVGDADGLPGLGQMLRT